MPTREAIVVTAFLAIIFEVAYLAAYFVRGELLLKPSDSRVILSTVGWVIGVKLLLFYWRGFCHRPWRAARFEDLNRLLRTATTGLLVLVAMNYFTQTVGWPAIPRSVLLLDWVFTLIGVGGMQALARSIYEEIMPITSTGNEQSVLVIDASELGQELAQALPEMRPHRYFVAGLLDDDPAHYGVHVGRARVLGPVSMAPTCAERLRATEIIVREDSVYGQRLRALCDACAAINVRVRIAEDHLSADPQKKRLTVRPIKIRDIELHDLLSRPHAHLDDEDFHVAPFIGERCVLVTGAGGSIGGEICRQLARFQPSKIVLVERSESALFEIHRDVLQRLAGAHTELVPLLGDITHADRMAAAFSKHRPAVVIHAAAFKNLPMMESHPIEAIENNTLATVALAELAVKHGVETFISLSTDKAVYPSSLMGASKLIAERFLESLGKGSKTKFIAVRFGNVLNSSGSAVPIFMEQLRQRQPITITNPSVRRYFLTGDEASQLLLLAGAIGKRSGVYVLEMGEPLSIVDLVGSIAFVMNIPQSEVQIEYCGLRPGEKIDEELFFADEAHEQTGSPFIVRAARPARSLAEVRQWLDTLRTAIAAGPDAAAAALMQIAVTASGPSPKKSAAENLTHS